jgi:cellulose synthase/poly-beta-1,6-N-acetylglucosamine synthase-like glycosyltransferase
MLLDVGTVPSPTAVTSLFTAMESSPDCGGAAGEIMVRNMQAWSVLDAVQVRAGVARELEGECGSE